jgi:glycosyltransferase involved in cell wall biosynthesis
MNQQDSNDYRGVRPDQVAMLCQGDEVYGVGTVIKVYADVLPSLWFVAMGEGPLVDWLRGNGNRVDVVPGLVRFEEGGASLGTISRMPAVMLRARRDAARIHRVLEGRSVRFVHAHWRPQQYIAGFMRRYGYQVVWHIHNNMNPSRLFGIGRKLNHNMAQWGADLIMPVSDFIARNWRGSGVPVRYVHNAVPTVFQSSNALPPGPVRCLIAGRLEHDKGHHLAVDAVLRAREAGLDVTLDVYGGPLENNSYADALRRRVAAAGGSDAVRFLGFQSDLRSRHQQYHLGLQCRIMPEPCSMWVCETLVDGLPLVASDSGGTPELVQNGRTGLLFPSGDLDALTARLIELASNPVRLHRMRALAYERGQKSFTVERFAQETLAAYALLAGSEQVGLNRGSTS